MALRDLMNNYFYGRQGKADFTEANLPKNRLELFLAVLKVRWGQMIGLNLLYLIIWIPAIAWTVVNLGHFLNDPPTGASALPLLSTWLVVLAPCVAITGPFNAGVTFVLRNWARDEHSFVLADFRETVRANWRQALAISCVSGALPLLVLFALRFYAAQLAQSAVFLLPMGLALLVWLVWTLATPLMIPMLVTYDLRLKDIVRNAILLSLARLPRTLLIRLITLISPLAAIALWRFVPGAQPYVLMVLPLMYAVFLLSLNKLITVSWANWLCETYLNPQIEGARTGIGLRPQREKGAENGEEPRP